MSLWRKIRSSRGLSLKDRPIYAHVGVTHRCNMRCRMCSIPARANQATEATPERFAVAAKEIADLGCLAVSLGGGEPFMRKDLPQIVEVFAKQGLRVRVLTNGATASAQMIADIASAGAKDISISLDSLDEKIQAGLEDRKGLLRKKFESISNVQAHFPGGGIHILNAVVTPQTLSGLINVARFAKAIGFYAGFIPVHIEKGHHFFTGDASLRFGAEDRDRLREVYQNLIGLRGQGGIVNSKKFLDNSRKYLLGEPVDWRCRAGALYLSIGPDARIAACHEFEDSDSVEPVGFAKRFLFEDWPRRAKENRRGCSKCFRPCWAEIDYLATDIGAFFGSLSMRLFGPQGKPARFETEELAGLAASILSDAEAGS
jgi:MoaA/NifB/PqqE/SkfB family radical SAM enzyme